MFLYYKNQKLKMVSESPIETELSFIEKDLTEDEKLKLKDSDLDKKIIKSKLVFDKTEEIKSKELNKEKIEKATTIEELKEIIKEII